MRTLIDVAGALGGLIAARMQSDGASVCLATRMSAPGVYDQRNAGHLLIGELAGGESERAEQVRRWLGQGVEVRVTANLCGAVWSKLLLNCSVTTIGAIAGRTMRQYIELPDGHELFDRTYEETLTVALATGVQPERMIVDPVPPGWTGRIIRGAAYEAWIGQVVKGYGDLKASMLQDFERGRLTEVDFINGYALNLGRQLGIPTPINEAIVETVHAISHRQMAPSPRLLTRILHGVR
jgi:2-dehydropantoate 2-reductase